jgi:hypothetical protein
MKIEPHIHWDSGWLGICRGECQNPPLKLDPRIELGLSDFGLAWWTCRICGASSMLGSHAVSHRPPCGEENEMVSVS